MLCGAGRPVGKVDGRALHPQEVLKAAILAGEIIARETDKIGHLRGPVADVLDCARQLVLLHPRLFLRITGIQALHILCQQCGAGDAAPAE